MTRAGLVALLLFAPGLLALGAAPAAAAPAAFAWGSDLSQWGSFIDADRRAAIDLAVATGMTTIGTDAKDAGPAGWASPTYPTVTRFAPGDGGVERVTRDAHAKGLRVAARFDVFQDSVAVQKFPGTALGGSPPWVDPACPEVRAYALAQVRELVSMVPVDEINFDHIRYPDASEVSPKPFPCTTQGTDRSAVIASWVKDAAAAARQARPGITVSISVFAHTMKQAMPTIGQDAALLATHVDVLRPMLYPSYDAAADLADPYPSVKAAAAQGVARFGAAKVQPWIQGFDSYGSRPDLVCAQFRALADAGATGGLVWWFPSTGTSRAFWDKVTPCVPRAAVGPSPSPGAFEATFTPKKGNEWWVETKVASAQTVVAVSASVDGGAPVALAKNKWGAWSKSFHVPKGSVVTFTATSSTGATATSGGYWWPSGTPVSTSPPPSAPAFEAGFRKGAANQWWVEVWVSANAPLAGVSASVNGGAPVALDAKPWGSWAKSFHVAKGSSIVFTATSRDGQRATSTPFAWP